jgi:Domain of unknown function (DUF4304)
MKKAHLILKIDEVLEKYQFHKSGDVWNRDYTDFVDVIDLQISKSKDMFTINAGVASKFVIRACWGFDGSSMVEEPSCTVRDRLGELLHGRDVWWSLSDNDGVEEALSGIQDAAIPFLQVNHSIDHMISTLENDPASRRYPPGVIYLALLHHQKGESDRCKEMFETMKLTGAWNQKASDILASLN